MKKIAFIALALLCFGMSKSEAFQFWGSGNTNIGTVQFAPVAQVTVSTLVPVNPTGTYMVIESTGNNLPLSAAVAIATASAVSGQYLVLWDTSSVSSVYITTGPATAVIGDDAVITITSTKSAVGFIYNPTLSSWVEIGKQ